ncbi:ras and Rab interactor 1 isoform X2 [Notamacropus eugenii]|uniref:ras and Rab interactor 1 isoform X2 n=1 Tax=Notamacropus eugenii TaxID=9315 RepID=UPI003B681A93
MYILGGVASSVPDLPGPAQLDGTQKELGGRGEGREALAGLCTGDLRAGLFPSPFNAVSATPRKRGWLPWQRCGGNAASSPWQPKSYKRDAGGRQHATMRGHSRREGTEPKDAPWVSHQALRGPKADAQLNPLLSAGLGAGRAWDERVEPSCSGHCGPGAPWDGEQLVLTGAEAAGTAWAQKGCCGQRRVNMLGCARAELLSGSVTHWKCDCAFAPGPGFLVLRGGKRGSGEPCANHGAVWGSQLCFQTFLVRKSNTRQCKALCVRLPKASGPSFVSSHDIQETPEGVSLEGSELSFPDLIQLISAYCHSRDILFLQLQLPRAIRRATTHKELEAISHLGMEFWNSSLNSKAQGGLAVPPTKAPPIPRLKPRSPEELDQGTGGALCFFNPLFPGDLGPAKREKFKRSFKIRVSTETSSPLSPPAVPPPPVPLPSGGPPAQTQTEPPRRLLRRESSGGYRVPGSTGPSPAPLPSLQEVDSGSPSSSEDEGGPPGRPGSSPLPGRRRRLLRSMSDAFCSLLAPERQVARAVVELARDRQTVTGQLVQDLLTKVRAGPEPQELQKVREVLSQAQTLMVAELAQEKLLAEERLELVIEKSLQRSVLKPLRPLLLARLRLRLAQDGSLGRLVEGLQLARAQGPRALGSCLSLPSPSEMERIRQKLLKLLQGYSPTAKVTRLLQACKLLYKALSSWAGENAGADEFLPLLSAVLAQCDLPDLLPETEYITELLEPSLLTGEASPSGGLPGPHQWLHLQNLGPTPGLLGRHAVPALCHQVPGAKT